MLLFLVLCATMVVGQSRQRVPSQTVLLSDQSAIVQRYVDSLAIAKTLADTLYLSCQQARTDGTVAIASDPRYMRLFTPLSYHPDIIARQLSLTPSTAPCYTLDHALINIYIYQPERVRHYAIERKQRDNDLFIPKRMRRTTPLTDTFDIPAIADYDFDSIDLVITKPNFWSFAGEVYLQAMQNYYSANWYQGLESNVSWLAKVALQANYDNKRRWTWDNKLEMNLGFQTNRSDEVHKLKTSDDLFRYTTKVGLQATKKWYYTVQAIANTQFMRSYESNTDNITSAFFAPLNINMSIGMTYNVSLCNNKLTGSVYLSPLAINYKFCHRTELAETNGIDAGRHHLVDYGSTATIEGTWTFNDIVSWTTRLYGYTSYHRLELQWENTCNVKVSRIIALTFYIYPRFDDSSADLKDHSMGYFQLKEYTSFGLTYSF